MIISNNYFDKFVLPYQNYLDIFFVIITHFWHINLFFFLNNFDIYSWRKPFSILVLYFKYYLLSAFLFVVVILLNKKLFSFLEMLWARKIYLWPFVNVYLQMLWYTWCFSHILPHFVWWCELMISNQVEHKVLMFLQYCMTLFMQKGKEFVPRFGIFRKREQSFLECVYKKYSYNVFL